MKVLKYWFPYFIIFGYLSFTIITTVIGYRYTEHSVIYPIYNIIIAAIIGTLATYLPFWKWDGLQVAGALALSMLAWMLIQGTETEGRRT